MDHRRDEHAAVARGCGVVFAITNDPPFGSQVGAFGGLSLGQISPGVYTVGTITVTAGAGSSVIAPFQRPEIDDWLDTSGYNTIVPTLNTARIGCLGGPGTGCAPGDPITPEPASAALLGVGLAVLATWRRSAERHAPSGASGTIVGDALHPLSPDAPSRSS